MDEVTLAPEQISKLVNYIELVFPNWQGFPDPRFEKEEVFYKQNAVEKAKQLLNENDLRDLIANESYEEFIDRLSKVGQAGKNLLWLAVPKEGDLSVINQENLDKSTFCLAVLDLIYGTDLSPDRLGRFASYLKQNQLPNKWAFATYFLFVCHPQSEMFVKPMTMQWFLQFAGMQETFTATLSADIYRNLLELTHQLREGLKNYHPRDQIDIQGFIWTAYSRAKSKKVISDQPNKIRYWKISPGDKANNWEYCLQNSVIAMGWDPLGDLTGLSDVEFQQVRDENISKYPDWTIDGTNQVWQFAHLRPGDKVIANKGTTEILGIGTVTGPYFFSPEVQHYRHQVPVEWEDTNRRSINEGGWRRTLIELDQEKYLKLTQSPLPTPLVEPAALFSLRAFELLDGIHKTPTFQYYSEHRDEFKTLIELPFQQLMQRIAARLPPPMLERLEIEQQIFSRFNKNDFGQGGAWSYYWGAFYPKGGKRITDAQLALFINYERFHISFYIGDNGTEAQNRFRRNLQTYGASLSTILMDLFQDSNILFSKEDLIFVNSDGKVETKHPMTWQEWLANPQEGDYAVRIVLSKQKMLSMSAQQVEDLATQTFVRLFPLILLTTEEDPIPAIQQFLGISEIEEKVKQPEYSLEQCMSDTGFDLYTLQTWVKAIHRKGQAILYGPPGTGKTYMAEKLAQHLIGGGDGFYELIQFHPEVSYEDFIQGIRPKPHPNGGLYYPVVQGRFIDFCEKARSRKDTCVLVIDEINRANLARVFGELMYLLEYRDKAVELSAGNRFMIPANVCMIGTMNTADRSIALVDHALRRRFAFLALYPNFTILRKYHERENTGFTVEGLISVLEDLNKQIVDRHYSIGPSYFLRKDLSSQIADIWQMEIEPYLEEYFFDQPEKYQRSCWKMVSTKIIG